MFVIFIILAVHEIKQGVTEHMKSSVKDGKKKFLSVVG